MTNKRCFSFNVSGQRCEREAGHDGDHQITYMWDDDASWTPLEVPYLPEDTDTIITPPKVVPIEADEELPPPTVCFVCSHVWHDAMCQMPKAEGAVCGCMTAVA